MNINAGAEKTNIEVKHLAAAIGPKVHRESVPKDLVFLQNLLTKDKGKSVFEAKLAKDDADTFVNFTEMRQMVDSEKDPKKPVDAQSEHWKEMNQKLTIYDKLLNGKVDKLGLDKDNNPDPAEKQVVLKVLGEIPGFAESIAISTGGKMSIEQARDFLLKGKGSIPPEARKTVAEMVSGFIGDDELRFRLEKSLSSLSSIIPEDDLNTLHEINDLKDKVKGKEALLLRKTALEDSEEKFKKLDSTDRQKAEDLYVRADRLYKLIKADYQPAALSEGGIENVIAQLKGQLSTIKTDISTLKSERYNKTSLQTSAGKAGAPVNNYDAVVKDEEASALYLEKVREQSELNKAVTQLESLKSIYADPIQNDLIQSYKTFVNAEEKLKTDVNPALLEVKDAEGKLIDKESRRNKYADKYKRKLERTLNEEMKRYWNEVKMEDASQAAEAEANEKKRVETKTKDKAGELLDKYLHLSFMKYKNGKEVGWDDKAIKEFMHKDMLSQSPAQLARTFIEHIEDKSGEMPPQYQEEIAKVFKDMGVGTGDPPLTMDKMLNGIDQKTYEAWAAKKVPDMLGYAWARGYYFDRMKLKPHEAEFLQEAYKDPEFFKAAMEGRDDQIKLAADLIKDGLISGAVSKEMLQKLVGKDWTEGSGRLMKLLAVGAGAYVLGGGLAFGTATKGQLAFGLSAVKDNLMAAKTAVIGTGVAISRASNAALHGIVGNYATASIPSNGGAADAGGILQKLNELTVNSATNSAPLPITINGPVTSP